MNHSPGKISFWTLTLCLLVAVSVVPPFANAQSPPSGANPASGANPKTAQPSDPTPPTAAAPPPSSGSTTTPSTTAPKSTKSSGAPSAQDIAAAKAAGKVWVNTETGVYHKSGRWYGKTKQGKFMTEADAKAAGYKAAK
jgi:hypothetical protein